MRRPRFKSWARSRLLQISNQKSFNIRKLCALAQAEESDCLTATLLLYAHEADCLDRLMSFIYEPDLRDELLAVEQRLGNRSIERLALRGTPMMSLPKAYRDVFEDYERAYRAPELNDLEKQKLQQSAYASLLRTGISPAEVAHDLGLDPGNMHAFLVRGETQRFTLDTSRRIERFLSTK